MKRLEQRNRIVEGFSDFFKDKFDENVLRSILNLNQSHEFGKRNISIEEIKPNYNKVRDNFIKKGKINLDVKSLNRITKVFAIHHPTINMAYSSLRDLNFAVKQVKKNNSFEYEIYFFGNGYGTGFYNDPHTAARILIRLDMCVKDILISNSGQVQSYIYNEIISTEQSIESAKLNSKNDNLTKLKKYDKYHGKFNKQFIIDHFSNVLDLCDGYEIEEYEQGYNPDEFCIRPFIIKCKVTGLKIGRGDSRFNGGFNKPTQKYLDIVSEIATTQDRLEEYELDVSYHTDGENLSILIEYIGNEYD